MSRSYPPEWMAGNEKGNDILDRVMACESPGFQEIANKVQSLELERVEG